MGVERRALDKSRAKAVQGGDVVLCQGLAGGDIDLKFHEKPIINQ